MIKEYGSIHGRDTFYSKDLRKEFRIAPATLKRHLRNLNAYGLIKIISGSRSKGYEYELLEMDEYAKLQENISNALDEVLSNIKN